MKPVSSKNNFDETGFIKVTIWTYLSVSYGYFTNYFVHHYPTIHSPDICAGNLQLTLSMTTSLRTSRLLS